MQTYHILIDTNQKETTLHGTFEFPVAQSDWGTISHGALMDAETGGNVIWWSALSAPRIVYSGDTIRFAPNTAVITLD